MRIYQPTRQLLTCTVPSLVKLNLTVSCFQRRYMPTNAHKVIPPLIALTGGKDLLIKYYVILILVAMEACPQLLRKIWRFCEYFDCFFYQTNEIVLKIKYSLLKKMIKVYFRHILRGYPHAVAFLNYFGILTLRKL